MPLAQEKGFRGWWERAARRTVDATGHAWAFLAALAVIVAWMITGPLFHFSDTWQLVINTGTTIITFLMVFLLQHAQNRDTKALHIKLNELVAAVEGASNRLIDVEDLSEEELTKLHTEFHELANKARLDKEDGESTSLRDLVPPVDRTLATIRPNGDDETPPGPPRSGKRGRPSS